MKCQVLFSEEKKKNISKCRLLKILPRVLSIKASKTTNQTVRPVDLKLILNTSCKINVSILLESISVTKLAARLTGYQEVGVRPPLTWQHSFLEI